MGGNASPGASTPALMRLRMPSEISPAVPRTILSFTWSATELITRSSYWHVTKIETRVWIVT